MNLYSNKQKWKITFVIIALMVVGASLFYSNKMVTNLALRERERVKNWAFTVKKKLELVQLTDKAFTQLRAKERDKMNVWKNATKVLFQDVSLEVMIDYTFPLSLIEENKDIPVIVLNNDELSSYKNLGFEPDSLLSQGRVSTMKQAQQQFNDSVSVLVELWASQGRTFKEQVYPGLTLTCAFDESEALKRLKLVRDSLLESFNQEVIHNVGLVPVVLVQANTDSLVGTNIPRLNTVEAQQKTIKRLKAEHAPLQIQFDSKNTYVLYYDTSPELKQIQYYPYIIFSIIGLFILIGYLVFSTFRKAEQNQVWAGMAKETAHQLGTPLSSLLAWIQYLETQPIDKMAVQEMQKDVDRLERVTDRFSKIGSGGKMEETDITSTIHGVLDYLKARISQKVEVRFDQQTPVIVKHNPALMQWVIENISKNAIDAMEGQGKLTVSLHQESNWLHIDIEDTGKGIDPKQLKTIFKPGFSTKKRGWGLGLSLVRRIVHEYHHGKVFVLRSEIDKGTTFRISIPNKGA